MTFGFPKPEPHKRVKARKKRREAKVVKAVRPVVAARDGHCRLWSYSRAMHLIFGACRGASEWAHWRAHSRAKTRGMDPEVRHTTDKTMMMCGLHHDLYDDGKLIVRALTERTCDGRLGFKMQDNDFEYVEAE